MEPRPGPIAESGRILAVGAIEAKRVDPPSLRPRRWYVTRALITMMLLLEVTLPMSVHWPIIRNCLLHPRRPFLIDEQRTWRGIDLFVAALHVAGAIEQTTSAKNIGLMLPTGGTFPMAALATWMLGRTVVPLNYLLKGEDLQYVCDHAEIDTIISVQPMLDFVGDPPTGMTYIKLDELSFKGLPEMRWPKMAADDDLAFIIYTSGTSGRPKGVMLSHGNVSANIAQCVEWANFNKDDIGVGILPQFHVLGLVVLTLMPLTVGCKTYFGTRFVPRRVVEMIRDHRPTVMIGIPSMYNALLTVKDATAEDFSCFRYLVSGGEPLPDDVQARFQERFNRTLNEGFGMTETSAVTHWCRPQEHRAHSVGRALPKIQTRIVSEADGTDLGPNQDGELRVNGPNIMQGYYKNPEATATAFDDKKFLRTGDMARVDDDGFLYITGRIKEMMIIGGENVFPREIEEVINSHPSVNASGVIGFRDPSRGEVPVAFVELAEGAEFDEMALRSHCRESLAGYKVPRSIYLMDALPRNPTGKILRRALEIPE